jgi:hypothetical protein
VADGAEFDTAPFALNAASLAHPSWKNKRAAWGTFLHCTKPVFLRGFSPLLERTLVIVDRLEKGYIFRFPQGAI